MTPDNPIIKSAIDHAQNIIGEVKQLTPMFFVSKGSENHVLAIPFDGDREKDLAAAYVKKYAEKIEADFILFMAESYAISDEAAAKDYRENREKYKNYMGNHPKAYEVVMLCLETHTAHWSGVGKILEGRKLEPIEWVKASHMEGRFANLLGKEKQPVH